MVDLESKIKIIVGAKSITLSYVIRENNAPDQTECNTWEENSVLAVPLTRRLYKQDNLTVYNIIFRNIADTSDTFTYVNPYIKSTMAELTSKCCVVGIKTLPCKSSMLVRQSIQLRPSSIEMKEQ